MRPTLYPQLLKRSARKALGLAKSIGFLCCLHSLIWAQEGEQDTFPWLNLAMQVEVTIASKNAETLAEAPSSVSLFTKAEIREMGITTLEELLNFVPGFMSQRQTLFGQTTTIQVRGKPENGYLSKDVLVLMNGVRLNDVYSGGSSMINRYVSLGLVKQVEVIRGPGSALYGSNAFLGVINIVTEEISKEAQLELGSFKATSFSIGYGKRIGDLRLSAFFRNETDGGDSYQIPQDFFGRAGGPVRDPQKIHETQFRIGYGTFEFEAAGLSQDLPFHMGSISVANPKRSLNRQNQQRIRAEYRHILSEKFNWTVRVSDVRGSSYMHWHFSDGEEPNIPLDFGAYFKVFNTNLELEANHYIGDKNTLTFGISREIRGVLDNAILANENGKVVELRGERGVTENVNQKVTAIFAQDRYHFSSKINGTMGLRYDQYSDFGSTINPRAALIYQATKEHNFKFMYGKAFSAPTNSESYQKNTLASIGNPNLKPETIKTTELSYSLTLPKFIATVTHYDSVITDLITLIPLPDSSTATLPVNQGTIHLEGLELELHAQPVQPLLMRWSLSKQFNDIDIWSSGLSSSMSLTWRSNHKSFNLNGIYHSQVEKIAEYQGSDTSVNGTFNWTLSNERLIFVNITNLFDRNSLFPDAPFTNKDILVERRGREITLGFRLTY